MNTTIIIILGGLVAVIAIFLIVSSIFDRKKRRKIKLEKDEEQKEIALAKTKIALALLAIIKANDKLLAKFVPSVGKLKMSDIKTQARQTLKALSRRPEYRYLLGDEENKDYVAIFKKFQTTNSNNWQKQLKHEIKQITTDCQKQLEKKQTEITSYQTEINKFVVKEYAHGSAH